MASIEPNNRDNPTVWRVKWRDNGIILPNGKKKPQTVTCHNEIQAEKLRALVDEAGNRMPAAKVLEAYGLQWVLGDQAAAEQPTAANRITVSDLCWLYLKAKTVSPKPPSERTLKEYRQYIRDHVDTHWFGKLDADDADQDQARDWQAETAAKPGYSPESANKVRTSVVAPAFKWARITTKKDQKPIRTWSSPFEGLDLLEETVSRRDRLENLAEIHTLIECAYEIDPNWADLVVVKLCAGSRYGEITMPKASNVKPRGIELVQRQTAGVVKQGTKAGTNIWRFAPLPDPAMDIVNLRAANRASASLVFHGPRGAKWAYQPYWRRWDTLRDRLDKLGIHKHLTRHCMRITCNSFLVAAGINGEVIRMMTGHAKPGEKRTMTGHYTGWTDAMMDAVVAITRPWLELPTITARIAQLQAGHIHRDIAPLNPIKRSIKTYP